MTDLPPPYRLVRPLGRGGMATVHLAWNEDLGCAFALKMLVPDTHGRFTTAAITRLREEGDMLASLRHPAIPRLHERLETDAVKALVMEPIDGETLDTITRGDSPPAAVTLLHWAAQLCDVLTYLHTLSPPVIYRDLKPGNIMENRTEPRISLIDFGNAKRLDPSSRRSTQTTARGVLTRGFAAVEQYLGGTDARSDIYALGITLHALASGHSPPEALAIANGKASLADLRTLRPDLPSRLHDAIEAMTQIDRRLRPQDVGEVLAMLALDKPDALTATEALAPDMPPTHADAGGSLPEGGVRAAYDRAHPALGQ
ncbi:MAG: serine/threonine protein kinase [Proteobacteria bacterium]|nr:serine/threonine protein kinase [Pseudomonadota bacterium]